MSRADLADRLGVSRVAVHRWETGVRKVDVDLLPRLVEITGIPAGELRPDLAELFAAPLEGAAP